MKIARIAWLAYMSPSFGRGLPASQAEVTQSHADTATRER
jgi:hypothetical protein